MSEDPIVNAVPLDTLNTNPSVAAVPENAGPLVRSFPGGIVRVWDSKTVPVHFKFLEKRWWKKASWLNRLQLGLFLDSTLWKAGFIEFIGTFLLTWMIIVVSCGILAHATDYSYFPTAISIIIIPIIAFMILATATTSGGHLNPLISFATLLAGLTEFPRFFIYTSLQVLASIAASYTAKHMLPDPILKATMLTMCSIGTDQTPSQALTLEIFCDLWVLFIAFGVALDERQRQVFPPWLAPFIIGTTIAILIYVTSTISPYGNGAIAFPTRCFGPAVAMGLVTADSFTLGNGVKVHNAQWIYWVGPIISSIIIAVIYRLVPPGLCIVVQEQARAKANPSASPAPSPAPSVPTSPASL